MDKSNGVENVDWARAPPPSGPVWLSLLKAIYNPEKKSFLGRTPKRWAIVLSFYTVFYAMLVLLFAVCMAVLFYTLEDDKPSIILEKSLIGANPGVASRPRPYDDGPILEYDMDDPTQYEAIIDQLDEFFKPYANDSWYASQEECVSGDSYGYPETPCFFIKLNKIYGWKPQFFSEPSTFPREMDLDLVAYINLLEPEERQQIWVSCWGEKGENVTVEYPWGRGLPGRYYPYSNTKGYTSPVLAVRFVPAVNRLFAVRCRAWARNVIYNHSLKEPSGYTLLQMQVTHAASNSTAAAD